MMNFNEFKEYCNKFNININFLYNEPLENIEFVIEKSKINNICYPVFFEDMVRQIENGHYSLEEIVRIKNKYCLDFLTYNKEYADELISRLDNITMQCLENENIIAY